MNNDGNALPQPGTLSDSNGNNLASADHPLTTSCGDIVARARAKLTHEEYVALIQADRAATSPAVYDLGLKDGAAKALERQSRERKQRHAREAKQRGERSAECVYFIQSETAVKIGVSRDPRRRLAVLRTGHPGRLEIAACCPGDASTEKLYHKRFAEHRLTGEWFSPHPDILSEIDRLNRVAVFAIDVSEAAV